MYFPLPQFALCLADGWPPTPAIVPRPQPFCITCKIISKHFVILLLDSWPYSIFKGPDEVANMCQGYTDAVFSVCLTCVKGAEYQLSPALAFSVNGPVFENEVCAS